MKSRHASVLPHGFVRMLLLVNWNTNRMESVALITGVEASRTSTKQVRWVFVLLPACSVMPPSRHGGAASLTPPCPWSCSLPSAQPGRHQRAPVPGRGGAERDRPPHRGGVHSLSGGRGVERQSHVLLRMQRWCVCPTQAWLPFAPVLLRVAWAQTLEWRPIRGLQDMVISYGPCQFPTTGFVVDR